MFRDITEGNISLARMYTEEGSKTLTRLDASKKASLRAKELAGQLLTFVKGRAPVKKTTPIVKIPKESAAFALQGANVNCAFNIEKDIPPVEVDPNQISQVINNIIINANQAMPDGGTIVVGCKKVRVSEADGFSLASGFQPVCPSSNATTAT